MLWHRWSLVLLVGVALLPGSGQAGEDRTLSPYFVVLDEDPAVDRLPLLGTDVEVRISGVIAEVRVVQTYKNEGLYERSDLQRLLRNQFTVVDPT